MHDPGTVTAAVQPGILVQASALDVWALQVLSGVPAQWGPVEKVTVAAGFLMIADLQQICPEQSLLEWQVLGHEAWQSPSQHKAPTLPTQSLDCVQAFGQVV